MDQFRFLTFDLEDWFHLIDVDGLSAVEDWHQFPSRIENMLWPILDLLDNYDVKASFFVLGWVAENYPHLINAIARRGHEIGSHSYSHLPIWKLTPAEFRADTMKSVELISRACDVLPSFYRAPGFSVTEKQLPWFVETLTNCGFLLDSSIFPIGGSHGGLSRLGLNEPFKLSGDFGSIIELPMSHENFLTKRFVVSGGGYFRLTPNFMLQSYLRKSKYSMVYLHLRDFDCGQPILKNLNLQRKFKAYVGIKSAKSKLEQALKMYEWTSISNVLTNENIKVVYA